ncbi:Tubulin-specific chaperone E [Nibea albiflora]|uniref:Tubulin-specific chaperone E n=1 Tax=Nibea albiflora TaxID=240163 RepID=A0ACB7FJ14_NIBAL|nr:Tubulin-specific chaperone E [Nibea albiflora]
MRVDQTVPADAVGRRVSCGDERATVRFVGPVPPTAGLWLGVEWDNPERGKHDGSHDGVQYFTCRHPKGGSLVRPAKVSFGVDYLTAVQRVYQINSEEVLTEGSSESVKWLALNERSNNRLCLPSDISAHCQAFSSLRVLALNSCDLTWQQILECAPMWPQLEDLCLEENNITELQRLEKMTLSQTGLSDIRFDDAAPGSQTAMFPALTNLNLDNNNITEWRVVDELGKLSSLVHLSCRRNRLVSSDGNHKTANQLLIAKLGGLVSLNGSEINPEDRRGAELDYIKMFGEEWLKAGGGSQPSSEFICQHPRYLSLIDKYGAPEEGELKKPEPFALKNQLLKITFVFPDDPERKPIEKKLPASMVVQKVKGLLYRQLKVPAADLKLSYTSLKMVGTEFEIDSDLKTLQFYSIEDGDQVLVRWS